MSNAHAVRFLVVAELLKLRKKTTSTVQVLTHVKEKLQYVQQEVAVQKEKLALQVLRDALVLGV